MFPISVTTDIVILLKEVSRNLVRTSENIYALSRYQFLPSCPS